MNITCNNNHSWHITENALERQNGPFCCPRCGTAGDMATLSHAGILRSLNFGARAPKSARAAA